jgi:negative regulator of sigma E activity
MRLKKNLSAKIVAVVASLVALIGTWGLVHQNSPASANDNSAAPTVQPTALAGQRVAPGRPAPAKAPQVVVKKKHTRTHVS